VKVAMKRFGLIKEDAQNQDRWRSLTTRNRPTLPQCYNEGLFHMDCLLMTFHINDDDEDEDW